MVRFQGCGLSNTIRRDIACQFTPIAVHRIFQEYVVFEVYFLHHFSTSNYVKYFLFLLAIDRVGLQTIRRYDPCC